MKTSFSEGLDSETIHPSFVRSFDHFENYKCQLNCNVDNISTRTQQTNIHTFGHGM